MVDITNILNNQGNTPVTLQAPTDPSFAAGYQRAVSGNDQLLGQEVSQLNSLRLQEKRAILTKNEADYQAQMALPQAADAIKKSALDAINSIAAIDETQRLKEVKAQEATYITGGLFGVESAYNDFVTKTNIPTNGDGYSQSVADVINKNMVNVLNAAPTEESKLELYQRLSKFKLDAVQHAFGLEAKQRENYRTSVVNSTLNEISNKVYLDPTNIKNYNEQLDILQNTLKEQGKDEAYISMWRQQADSKMYQQQVDGFIANSQFGEGLKVLSDEKTIKSMDTNQYMQVTGRFNSALSQFTKNQSKQADLQAALAARISGHDYPDAPLANKAAELDYQNYAQQTGLDNLHNISDKDIGQATSALMSYFNNRPTMLGDYVKNLIQGGVKTSSNPNEAAALSRVIYQIKNDPTSKLIPLLGQLDKDTLDQALLIGDQLSTGKTSLESVTFARDVVKNKSNYSEQQINAYNKDNGDYSSDLEKTFGTSWSLKSADEDIARLSYEMPKRVSDYMKAGYSGDRAKELALLDLKQKAGYTDINGSGQIMIGAPDKYYNDRELDVVKGLIENGISDYAKQAGLQNYSNRVGEYTDAQGLKRAMTIGIKPWVGVTEYGNNNSRLYLLADMTTGQPLTEPGNPLRLATIDVGLNQTEYQKKTDEFIKTLSDKANERKSFLQNTYKTMIDTTSKLAMTKSGGVYVS